MDYKSILKQIETEIKRSTVRGKVASYIPELAKIPENKLGFVLHCIDDTPFTFGDAEERFSIQSISKVFALTLAFNLEGSKLWKRVGVEPSGDPFNSLVQLEYEEGIPRNPFINAGALVLCDVLLSHFTQPEEAFLNFIKKLCGCEEIRYNDKVAQSEKSHGHRNAALVNLMKSFGNIHNPVSNVLDFYFKMCSIEMNCFELAKSFQLFANDGVVPQTGERILSVLRSQRINAIMQTCGFYDEAGEFSFRVGLPGKSGVGGGIVAVAPHEYTVAVWSPPLNKKGNSYLGMKALEILTTETESSIF